VCSGPREDATRIGSAGVVRRQAVDISPLRRVNQAIWLLTTGAREAAFRNVKTISECLADELMNAAKGSSNSYAIKKKGEQPLLFFCFALQLKQKCVMAVLNCVGV
jgi:small subunit ribosomal protein S5e